MTNISRPDSQQDLVELFELFGNNTRRKILQALWEQFEFNKYMTESRDGTPFSELREQVGVTDSGNFNYHLGKLTGNLVEKREDGYVLTPLGYNLLRSIDDLTAFSYETEPEQQINTPCPFCGGDLFVTYSRELLTVRCRDCEALSSGRFTTIGIRATAGRDLSVDGLLRRAALELFSKLRKSRHGICWDCSDKLTRELVLCESHEPGGGGTCPDCEHRYATRVRVECQYCSAGGLGPLFEYALTHPATIAFYDRHDAGPTQVGPWEYRVTAFEGATETIVDHDPVTVAFRFECEGEPWRLTAHERPDGLRFEPENRR